MPSLKRLVLLALACSIAGTVARAEIVYSVCPRVASCMPTGAIDLWYCDRTPPQYANIPAANNEPCQYDPRYPSWHCKMDPKQMNRANSYAYGGAWYYRVRIMAPCLCNSVNGRTQC